MKIFKSIVLWLSLIIIFTLITTILNYFDLLSNNILNILKSIFFIIINIVIGIYNGKNTNEKGYLCGIKLSLVLVFISIILSLLNPNENILLQIVYYIMTSLLIIIGSVIGINLKINNK